MVLRKVHGRRVNDSDEPPDLDTAGVSMRQSRRAIDTAGVSVAPDLTRLAGWTMRAGRRL